MIEQPAHALPRDSILHDYRILSVLGEGGFGITYKAEDVNLGNLVAIKEYLPAELAVRRGEREVLPRSAGTQDDFYWGRKEFLEEAKTLAQFDHPNIVRVLRFFEANGTAYIVMAFQEGDSLFDVIRRGSVRQQDVESFLPPILDGLAEVHQRGYLHRDIKPENVFIRKDGTPVLLDFGAARQALGNKTRTLTSIVSRGYAPFEQYTREGRQGPWSDIYALGAVLYAAITGEPPPDATDRMERDAMVPAVEAGRGRFDEGFLRAVDWALAVRAPDRPQDLAEWCATLAGEASATTADTPPLPRGETLRPGSAAPAEHIAPRAPKMGAFVAGALAVLAVAGGLTWLFLSRESAAPPVVEEAQQQPAPRAEAPSQRDPPAEREITLDPETVAAAERAARDRAERERAVRERAEREAEARAAADTEARRRAAEEEARVREEAGEKQADEAARRAAETQEPPADGAAQQETPAGSQPARPEAGEIKPARKPAAPPSPATAPPAAAEAAPQSAAVPEADAALRALFSGAIIYVMTQKSHPIRNDVWRFQPDGSLEGAYSEANNNPQLPDYTGSDRGSWSVEAGRLCTRWASWDDGARRCYRITGSERNYRASGGGGLLEGPFQLNK